MSEGLRRSQRERPDPRAGACQPSSIFVLTLAVAVARPGGFTVSELKKKSSKQYTRGGIV